MVFGAKDPRGYEIQLTEACWYNHILIEHPEMKGRVGEVRRAIETPDYIYQSKRRRSSHLYFREVSRGLSGVNTFLWWWLFASVLRRAIFKRPS